MDPNETLKQLREWRDKMRHWEESGKDPDEPGEYYLIASSLAEIVGELDGWLSLGGFPPDAWQPPLVKGEISTSNAARRRLELVFDRALRDDEELDRLTAGVERAYGPVVLKPLFKLLAQAVLDEIETERRQWPALDKKEGP